MSTYFAADGSYGDAVGMSIIHTGDWSEDAWWVLDQVSNPTPAFAGEIDRWQKTGEVAKFGVLYSWLEDLNLLDGITLV